MHPTQQALEALRPQFEAAYVAAYPTSSTLDPAQFHREQDGQYERVQVQTAWTLYCAALSSAAPAAAEPVAIPAGWKLIALPVEWTPGANVFKDWCGEWFGPDSDDDHLMKAVHALVSTVAVQPAPSATSSACETCNGRGEVGGFVNAANGYDAETCPGCKGSGEGGSYRVAGTESDFEDGPCHSCGGSGEASPTVMDEKGEREALIERAWREGYRYGAGHHGEGEPDDADEQWQFKRSDVLATLYAAQPEAETSAEKAADESKPRNKADIRRVLTEWNDVTGALPDGGSWFYEVEGMMEDAFDCGAAQAGAPVAETVATPMGEVVSMGGGWQKAVVRLYPCAANLRAGAQLYTSPPAPEEGKDAARYRWLRDRPCWTVELAYPDGTDHAFDNGATPPIGTSWSVDFYVDGYGTEETQDNLDRAIDAAMAQGEKSNG